MSWAFFLFSYTVKNFVANSYYLMKLMMEKTNLPRLILSRLDKLSPSVFIKRIFLTRGLSLVFSKDIPTSQVGLEASPFNSNVGHNFLPNKCRGFKLKVCLQNKINKSLNIYQTIIIITYL